MEKSVIERCLAGDRKAQEVLYKSIAPKVKGWCMRYARTVFEVEDIVQESFIKIFKNLKNYSNTGPFDAWARRIVINTAIDSYKSNLFSDNQVNIENTTEIEVGFAKITDTVTEAELLKILNQLPNGYKIVFNMYAIEGYSHKEIAEILKISEGTSKSQLSKAREAIKKLLVQYNYIENDERE
ncbi:MAG: RNA polymerase sigma factor [Cytophagales bacterium]